MGSTFRVMPGYVGRDWKTQEGRWWRRCTDTIYHVMILNSDPPTPTQAREYSVTLTEVNVANHFAVGAAALKHGFLVAKSDDHPGFALVNSRYQHPQKVSRGLFSALVSTMADLRWPYSKGLEWLSGPNHTTLRRAVRESSRVYFR